MKINWKEEVLKRKDDLLKDIIELIEIESVRDLERRTMEEPLGPECAKALQKMLSYGKRDGFQIKNIDNLVGHIEFGNSYAESFGILGHVDVVPAGEGWNTNPFKPEVKDGKLFGRGVSDDKGPTIAAYYGMKIIKDLDLPVNKKIRFIVGTDEESEWLCMQRYQEVEQLPKIGFSPDANFPIINGEKGIVSFNIFKNLSDEKDELQRFTGGVRSNMVPGEATARINVNDMRRVVEMQEDFKYYYNKEDLSGETVYKNGSLNFVLRGKSAHAQSPQDGKNAATYLAQFLVNQELKGPGAKYLDTVSSLHEDYFGEKLGVTFMDRVMGPLTLSPNIFTYETSSRAELTVNVRHPKGITPKEVQKKLEDNFKNYTVKMEGGVKHPHYVSGSDPFIQTLLDVYEEHTGEEGFEFTIGGGTYGRILEKGCAYGALFPGRENVMHQPNEYMYVEDILKAAIIYADALYRLVK